MLLDACHTVQLDIRIITHDWPQNNNDISNSRYLGLKKQLYIYQLPSRIVTRYFGKVTTYKFHTFFILNLQLYSDTFKKATNHFSYQLLLHAYYLNLNDIFMIIKQKIARCSSPLISNSTAISALFNCCFKLNYKNSMKNVSP